MENRLKCYDVSSDFRSLILEILESDCIPLVTSEEIRNMSDIISEGGLDIGENQVRIIEILKVPALYDIELIVMSGDLGRDCRNAAIKEWKDNPSKLNIYTKFITHINEIGICGEDVQAIAISADFKVLNDNAQKHVIDQLFRIIIADESGSMFELSKNIFHSKVIPDGVGELNIANLFLVLNSVNIFFKERSYDGDSHIKIKDLVSVYILSDINVISTITGNFRTYKSSHETMIGIIDAVRFIVVQLIKMERLLGFTKNEMLKKLFQIKTRRKPNDDITQLLSIFEIYCYTIFTTFDSNLLRKRAFESYIEGEIDFFCHETGFSAKSEFHPYDLIAWLAEALAAITIPLLKAIGASENSDFNNITTRITSSTAELYHAVIATIPPIRKIMSSSKSPKKMMNDIYTIAEPIYSLFNDPALVKTLKDHCIKSNISVNSGMDLMYEQCTILITKYPDFLRSIRKNDLLYMLMEKKHGNLDLSLGELVSRQVLQMVAPKANLLELYIGENPIYNNVVVGLMKKIESLRRLKPTNLELMFKESPVTTMIKAKEINSYLKDLVYIGFCDAILKPSSFVDLERDPQVDDILRSDIWNDHSYNIFGGALTHLIRNTNISILEILFLEDMLDECDKDKGPSGMLGESIFELLDDIMAYGNISSRNITDTVKMLSEKFESNNHSNLEFTLLAYRTLQNSIFDYFASLALYMISNSKSENYKDFKTNDLLNIMKELDIDKKRMKIMENWVKYESAVLMVNQHHELNTLDIVRNNAYDAIYKIITLKREDTTNILNVKFSDPDVVSIDDILVLEENPISNLGFLDRFIIKLEKRLYGKSVKDQYIIEIERVQEFITDVIISYVRGDMYPIIKNMSEEESSYFYQVIFGVEYEPIRSRGASLDSTVYTMDKLMNTSFCKWSHKNFLTLASMISLLYGGKPMYDLELELYTNKRYKLKLGQPREIRSLYYIESKISPRRR